MSTYTPEDTSKITARHLTEMKARHHKIAMLTAYDYTTARIVDQAGVDAVLVGDSASNVMAGNATTVPITLDEMICYARSVARGVSRALVVCDMPFGTYHTSPADAVRNAVRVMQQTGVDALKLEGGHAVLPAIRAILATGIPVMGHLGLTPQSIHLFGSYGVRAREEAEAETLVADARALAEAGCFALVVEKIPASLTARVVRELPIPIIGIGGGSADGQVLVIDDMLGKNTGFSPKFLRRYANLADVMTDAIGRYVADVKSGDFPNEQESY